MSSCIVQVAHPTVFLKTSFNNTPKIEREVEYRSAGMASIKNKLHLCQLYQNTSSRLLSDPNLKVGSVPPAPRELLVELKEKTSLLAVLGEPKVNLGISSLVIGRVGGGEAIVGVGGGSSRELGALGIGNVKLKPLLVFLLFKTSATEVGAKFDFRGC